MTDIKCLDSSAWLAYHFATSTEIKEIIDKEGLIITSSLCLFEIKKKLLMVKQDWREFLKFIKERSGIIVPEIEITENAAQIAVDKKLGAMDALIYATAQIKNAELITGDNDFRGLEKVRIIS
ncbi:MAG: PIN domain-containing protein [Nanoarchaeota archaeon]